MRLVASYHGVYEATEKCQRRRPRYASWIKTYFIISRLALTKCRQGSLGGVYLGDAWMSTRPNTYKDDQVQYYTLMQLRLTCSATFSKSPLNFTMYFRPLVKRPQRISTEKMFFFKNGMVGSSSQVKWCLQTKYQLLTRNLKICDGHPSRST